ncbi:MAG TPA: hypothetical protein VL625_03150 [Patescibacteria group bacterium]|jgi:hypothetical protein|nr:hypothetical protein [Patescibacteria group bacterium]
MNESKPGFDKRLGIAGLLAVAAIGLCGAIYMKNQQNKQTITLNLGGQTFSATIDKK